MAARALILQLSAFVNSPARASSPGLRYETTALPWLAATGFHSRGVGSGVCPGGHVESGQRALQGRLTLSCLSSNNDIWPCLPRRVQDDEEVSVCSGFGGPPFLLDHDPCQ